MLFSLCFTAETGGVFVLNQYFDREADRVNEVKRGLPIASGAVSPRCALFVFFCLISVSFGVLVLVDPGVLPLFGVYVVLWVCYSAPPLRLKGKPMVDVVVAGLGSGVLPFLLGLQVSSQLTLEFSLFWIWRRYQDAVLCVVPLMLVQSAKHIYQAVGDYEADLKTGVQTFVVKYGKGISLDLAKYLLLTAAALPLLYGFLNLSLTPFLHWYLIILLCMIPGLLYVMKVLQNPSKEAINRLWRVAERVAPIILLVAWVYVYLIMLSLS